MRLVLRENADPQVAGIDEIGEHEIDQAIGATEGNCGFGPVRGQRIQPLALTAGQDNAQHVWCFPHGYKLSATANRCQGAGSPPEMRAVSSPNYGAVYAGGDDDSGVSPRRLRWSRGTRHRTGRSTAPTMRGRRALHGRAPSGRLRPSARPPDPR